MKSKFFLLINVFFPLFFALFIYTFLGSGTYINDFFDNFYFVRELRDKISFQNNIIALILRYYICDFLWAYSFTFCVSFFLEFKKKLQFIIMLIFCSIFCLTWELAQLSGVVPGTFDFLDIVAEIFAVSAATLLIYKTWRKNL